MILLSWMSRFLLHRYTTIPQVHGGTRRYPTHSLLSCTAEYTQVSQWPGISGSLSGRLETIWIYTLLEGRAIPGGRVARWPPLCWQLPSSSELFAAGGGQFSRRCQHFLANVIGISPKASEGATSGLYVCDGHVIIRRTCPA